MILLESQHSILTEVLSSRIYGYIQPIFTRILELMLPFSTRSPLKKALFDFNLYYLRDPGSIAWLLI
jgi:hypothetical protein